MAEIPGFIEPRLAIDWDNTIVDTMPHYRLTMDSLVPGGFPPSLYDIEPPRSDAPAKYLTERLAYFRDPANIAELKPKPGVPVHISIIMKFFGRNYISTGRWNNALQAIVSYCGELGIAGELTGYALRTDGMSNAESKALAVGRYGITYAIEDSPDAAFAYAALGVNVFVPEAPWNYRIYESPQIMKVPDLEFISEILVECGTPQTVFERHSRDLAGRNPFITMTGAPFEEIKPPVFLRRHVL